MPHSPAPPRASRRSRGLPSAPSRGDAEPREAPVREQRGIQSVEVGGQLLQALADLGRPLALKDLAASAGMSPAKAHPYLVSFGKLGLVQQDPTTGRYGLGPMARQLGLIGLQQVDAVRLGSEALPALALELGHTVGLAVWGHQGPTIVRVEPGPGAVFVNMRHGVVVSVRGTASGRLFAAWARPATRRLAGLDAAEAARIREAGVAVAPDGLVKGISAAAAAVFDATGDLVLALIAIGPSAVFDTRPQGALVCGLREAARSVSAALGAPAAASRPLAEG